VLCQAGGTERRNAFYVLLAILVVAVPGATVLPVMTPALWLVLAALAVVLLGPRVPATLRPVFPVALGILLALPQALILSRNPVEEDGRTAIRRVTSGGPVAAYIPGGSTPAWLYYSSRWDGSDARRLSWYLDQSTGAGAGTAAIGDAALRASPSPGVWYENGRLEIVGTPPGVVFRTGRGFISGPRPGWPDSEAARVSAVTRGPLVIIETHVQPGANQALIEAMRATGWQVDSTFSELTATATYLHRVR
jgi:hypothetical protein